MASESESSVCRPELPWVAPRVYSLRFGLRIRDVGLAPRSSLLRSARGGGQVGKVPPDVEHSSKTNRRCRGSGFGECYPPDPMGEEGQGALLKG